MITIAIERPEEGPAVEELLDTAFGPERWARPSYYLRQGLAPVAGLCRVARARTLVGTVRYWPIVAGGGPALLLGPLAVAPGWRGAGIASALVRESLAAAAGAGHDLVIAVGEPDFFARFGFTAAAPFGLVMPVAVETRRLLVRALGPEAPAAGAIARADAPLSARAAW